MTTTTLNAETGKNTSAADSFPGSPNGNIAAGVNVSKVPISSLLYPGAATKMYAHFMAWFGFAGHYDIGYRSDDPAVVKAQVTDMLSRGISGMIIDWYGQGSHEDLVSLVVKPEVESRGGQFEFAIMEDIGSRALNPNGSRCSTTSACTSGVVTDLTYTYNTYIKSPAYIRWNGRPVIFFFSVESLPVDWTAVRASLPENPILIFQNSGGFTRTYSDGGFAWVMPGDVTISDLIAVNYLNNFYSTALSHSNQLSFGTGYKGFDDTIADWSANRHMQQQCGQTWLASMAEISKYYDVNRQLSAYQLVTWNDYEEGTEIETGIDNCLSINAALNGTVANWSVTGNENTLDHYTLFISSDGQNLMSLGDYTTSTHNVDLSTFEFDAGTYTVFVKAVGKPSIINHMSGALTYTVSSPPPVPPAPPVPVTTDFTLAAPAASATVAKGDAAKYTLSVIPAAASTGNVVFSCSGLPEGTACTFNPGSVTLGNAPVPVNVSISTNDGSHASKRLERRLFYAITAPVFGVILAGGFLRGRSRRWKVLVILLTGCFLLLMSGCGGAGPNASNTAPPPNPETSSATAGTPAGNYTVTITATSAAVQRSTTVSLTVQ